MKKLKKFNYGTNPISIKTLFILFCILLISSIQLELNFQTIQASSKWLQTTDLDFKNGTYYNITITPNGDVKLALELKYVEDNFINESGIIYKENITVDVHQGKVKPILFQNDVNEIWNKTFGGIGNEEGYSVQETSDGSYILVGYTESNGGGNTDVWLIKTNSFGNEQWNKTFGGIGNEKGYSVQETSDSGYILVGYTESNGGGNTDVWLIKTNNTGYEQWNRTFGGNTGDKGYSIQQTMDGGFIITGYTSSYAVGLTDVWLIKTNNLGYEEWNHTFGGDDWDEGYSVQETSDGGYIITGCISWSYGDDVWLIKTNSSGYEEWNKTFGGINSYSVQETSDGGYIVGGYTYGEGSNYDVLLIKTNKTGDEQWNKTFNRSNFDMGRSVQQTNDGGYIIGGVTEIYGLDEDIWIIKADSNGTEQWNVTFDGNQGLDCCLSIQQTFSGDYIILGSTEPNLSSKCDMWLIKINITDNLYANGTLISKNLIKNYNTSTINSFKYSSDISVKTCIKIQFSQDLVNWYNSPGMLNKWDFLNDGTYNINLSSLNWSGSNFYYKARFLSSNLYVPTLQNINLSFSQYLSFGSLISQNHVIDQDFSWKSINWKSIEPNGTEIAVQIRTAENQIYLDSKPFIGPDGTSNSYYKISGELIWLGHTNQKWIQYKIFLITKNTSKTPILNEIFISFNLGPVLNNPQVVPIKGDITNIFNFTVNYIDKDNDAPVFIIICIDNTNYTMNESNIKDIKFSDGKSYWFTTFLKAGNHSYQFFGSDGEMNCSTEILKMKVDFGPLAYIIIEPSTTTITTDEYQIFTAKGFDVHHNLLSISPIWEVTGGGDMNQKGNFTATTPGEWIVYANSSGIRGNTSVTVTLGTLNQIRIIPNYAEINISESIEYKAKGYDKDKNEINISPLWEVNGGGSIDISGKFTGTIPGKWIIYANLSGILGRGTIKVIQLEDDKKENESENDTNEDGNDIGKDEKKENKDNTMLFVGIGVIIVIIIILIFIFLFIFNKKPKEVKEKIEVKSTEEPITPIQKSESQSPIQNQLLQSNQSQYQTTQQINKPDLDTPPSEKINQEQ